MSYVMRIRVNEPVKLFDGFGLTAEGLSSRNGLHARGLLRSGNLEKGRKSTLSTPAWSVVREKNMDGMLQKAALIVYFVTMLQQRCASKFRSDPSRFNVYI